MVFITYINADGSEKTVDVPPGRSVMEGAVMNNIEGIIAECGGACSCATCHGYVDEAWMERVGGAQGDEADMLEFSKDVRPNSRLTCQIEIADDLEGLKILIPTEQG